MKPRSSGRTTDEQQQGTKTSTSEPKHTVPPQAKTSGEKSVAASERLTEKSDGSPATVPKSDGDRSPSDSSVSARPSFEDNIVWCSSEAQREHFQLRKWSYKNFFVHGVAGIFNSKWLTAGGLGTVLLTLAGRESIVADMRKVLAKNPQIEQQRLHRRVFLDNINPENQALLILVSCFVKTSHFEEYLCVKEAIFLDLLRVISHHRARLATPIRTVQKIYGDAGVENIPFADTIFTRADVANRPLLLIEPSSRINGDEKMKPRSSGRTTDEQQQGTKTSTSEPKVTSASESHLEKHQQKKVSSGEAQPKSTKADSSKSPTTTVSSQQSATVPPQAKTSGEKSVAASESLNEKSDGSPATVPKSDGDRSPSDSSVSARPSFEDNIVLGVALEGSKRTLPIEEVEVKEVGAAVSGNGAPATSNVKDRKNEVPTKDR
ncbi:hypothetical protein KFK09_009204 [Dendrobium nobile]|uniref:Mechanosensitive ion channel protein 2/3 C-terminal domain-containing protein n=1 Tax=Dendrobium nobile TaxID=94219 RepID=A0A8T3BN64_DENNO|nr:hypothetical protein KFK09_009204 [Dendrobium nobile]